ncbi:hypothetical protein GEMRC1_003512 [Eukaryota sp. GEM-RC1]
MAKIQVIYGSDTGNSEEFATEIADHFGVEAVEGDAVEVSELPEAETLIIVTSTSGDGEFPGNFEEFYTKLEEEKPDLSNTKFAVFGLGSTSYDEFCAAAKKVEELLPKFGASKIDISVSNYGDDEDADGFKTKAEPWFEQLKQKLS